MKLLVLGGTRFLGRHVSELALAAGHQLTLFHRGRSSTDLFPQAEHRLGDRDADLTSLQYGTWDAVIDTSAYFPRQVLSAAAALSGRVGHYQLVSSISVYAAFDKPGLQEDAPLQTLADPNEQALTGATYGGLKALCERAAMQAFGHRCLVTRPGLLVGPHDPTGRFTWWLQRAGRGGDMLAPGEPTAPVQLIDARDAAAWMLLQAERRTAGVFNLTGPPAPFTIEQMLACVRSALNKPVRLQWVAEDFLLEQGVAPWTDLPVWVPRASAGLHEVDISRALASGLQCRPLAQTVVDTVAWAAREEGSTATSTATGATPPAGVMPRPPVGLSAEREQALLEAWRRLKSG
ncbi:MAG TPA: NAD-dependent epimerase/dehydratase family protein [Rubrivivax sp.]|nr:NAD-dependent epimerase/dehydratase family protein [Rubrivivax sp.]